jgi:peptide/nickel transport system substrate-binding protein
VYIFRPIALVAVVSIAVISVAGCQATPPADGPSSLRIGIQSDNVAGQFDPFTTAMWQIDISAVYETLAIPQDEPDLSKDFGLRPHLAESFELDESRRTLTVELRQDVRFADGDPVNAQAVVDLFHVYAHDETSPWYSQLGQFGVEFAISGEYSFDVTSTAPLDGPDGSLGTILATAVIVNPKALADREHLAQVPDGTGPYRVVEVVPEVSTTLERDPDYWGGDSVYPFDDVEILIFEDNVALLNALKSGQIDAAPTDVSAVSEAESSGFTIFEHPGRFTALWIADRGGTIVPALGDVRVRQALSYAFDREAINDAINLGRGLVTSQGANTATPEYVEGGDDRYGYDVEKARSLMAEAGYADGFDVTIPTTTFLGISEWQPIVEEYLGALGIRITWEPTADADAYFTAALSGQYPILLYTEQPIGVGPIYLYPGAIFDHPAFVDPVVAEYWETVRTGQRDEVLAARQGIGQYTLDQAWLAVFATTNEIWAAKPGVAVKVLGDGTAVLRNFGISD